MTTSNELVIDRYTVSREDQDRYALRSHERALNAIRKGLFREEIVPVKVPQKKGEPKIFDTDEHPRETSMEALAQLKPVFKAGGKTTAGNASAISDGASATVVMAREKAKELGCPELAVIRSQASAGIDMKFILVAPTLAIPKVLKKEGIKIEDVDLFEINEAFAGSTVAVIRELGIDMEKVNVNGGAIALGHPIGASGSRVLTTLIYEMMRRNSKIGLASLCLGGGEAVALIVRRDV